MCLGGAALSLSFVVMLALPIAGTLPRGHGLAAFTAPRGLYFLTALLLLIGGCATCWRAESRLNKGLRLEWWSEGEVAAFREQIDRPVWKYAFWGASLAAIGLLLLALRHSPVGAFGYPILVPLQTISRLRQALQPPKTVVSGIPWEQLKPIHSEHWGKRSAG